MADPLRVLVASDDPAFVRLAAVALSRSGQTVRTSRLATDRILRVISAGMTDVVVVDKPEAATTLRAAIAKAALPVGIVEVRDEGVRGVTKFGPTAALVAEVQIAAEEAKATKPARHLRIVS